MKLNYEDKFESFVSKGLLDNHTEGERLFLREKAFECLLTFQELKKLSEYILLLRLWQEGDLSQIWPKESLPKDVLLKRLEECFKAIQGKEKSYEGFKKENPKLLKHYSFKETPPQDKIMGLCPVASEKTRCCNLLTLDAFRNCGFDCSYCSIQSFYHNNEIMIDKGLAEKLSALKIEEDKIYHIGTGQSSDSLMWGNKEGLLEKLIAFARAHPNVILELKTKSKNISELISLKPPRNVLTTWTLNAPSIIQNEEYLTASLEERIEAARAVASQGLLVGFHFHPMVWFEGFEKEYEAIVKRLTEDFLPSEVALVSLGTLTYTKTVMNRIRKRGLASKILQMPLKEIAGKYSYPREIKLKLFKTLYQSFEPWKNKVFFYMCMEDPTLWSEVFGFEYESNEIFEASMKKAYLEKIRL